MTNKDTISSSNLYFTLFGYVVGVGIWALPKSQVAACHQDGWIPTLVGGIYPFVIAILSLYIIKNRPNQNILELNLEFFGKFIGTFINIIFFSFFFLIGIFIASGFNNILVIYGVPFLSPLKILGIGTILTGLAAFSGIKLVGKINKVVFYITIMVLTITIPAFWKGTSLNLKPMFQSSTYSIVKGAIDTFYSYSGFEVILLLHTNVTDKENISKKIILSVLTVISMYVYAVVVSIFYSGPDIVVKSLWPFVVVSESTRISILNNFRFVFSSTWILIALKILTNYYYACGTILQNFFKKLDKQYIYIFLYFLFLYTSMKLCNESFRRYVIDLVSLYYVLFNFILISTLALFIFFKKGFKNEKT